MSAGPAAAGWPGLPGASRTVRPVVLRGSLGAAPPIVSRGLLGAALSARAVVRAFVLAAAAGAAIDAAAQGSVAGDRAALAALYDATGGPDWTDRTNWTSDEPIGAWRGVATDADGRVAGLALPGNDLAGTLPAALGRLTRLRRLDLGGNRLGGPIPAGLGSLVDLRELSLWNEDDYLDPDDDGLTGPIPAELGNLADLARLDLGGNDLTGPIPARLGNLTGLRELILARNGLTGEIPAALGNLTSLHWLDLGRNRLTGALPAALGRLTSLYTLALGQNDLAAAPIPGWLGNLAGLSALSLSRANVTGPLPAWLGNLADLQRVDLSYNWDLAGPLPPDLDLSHLERLDVFATRACAPAAWRSWLAAIDFAGALCGADADVIDVAVFHTPAARVAAGGPDEIDAVVELYVAETNQAFEESGVRTRVALAAREEVDYAETGEYDEDIDRLRNPSDGHLDSVHAVRDRSGADLAHLIVAELDVCGVAELGGPFGITRHGCGGRTFAHELGHNLGLHHDRYELLQRRGRALSSHPGYGYVNQRGFDVGAPPDRRWLTVMAYWTQCADNRVSCTSLLRFSNPRQTWLGDTLGVPADADSMGEAGPADAAAVLDATAPVVADFRRGSANRPPVALGTLPDRTLQASGGAVVVDVAGAFRDPDGDALTYVAVSSAPAVATAQAAGARVTLAPAAAGAATITVTAADIGGSNTTAAQRFVVTVAAAGCAFRATPERHHVPWTGGPLQSAVTTAPGCLWAATSRAGFIRVTGGPRVAGSGTATYTVAPNPGAPRTGSLTVAGRRVTVFQASRAFTDHPLRPGVTPIRAVHFLELRARIDDVRRGLGLSAFGWTDPIVTPGVTPVRRVHLLDLRTAADQAYTAADRPAPSYTDTTLRPGVTVIRAAHVMELRAAVAALE